MEQFELEVKKRDKKGTNVSRNMRREGLIPSILYGNNQSQTIEVDAKVFKKLFKKIRGEQALINLTIKEGTKETKKTTLLKDIQFDPVSDNVFHIDFQEISMDKELKTTVPVELVGDSQGVKDGGVMEHIVRYLEIKALPANIPDKFTLDVSGLLIGHSLTVAHITPIPGVTILTSKDKTAAAVLSPTAVKEEAAAAAAAAAAAEGVVAAEETVEPEVIGKEKKEEEGEEAEKGEKTSKVPEKKEEKKEEKKK